MAVQPIAEETKDPLDDKKYYIGKSGLRQADVVEDFNLDYHEGSALKYLIRRGKKHGGDMREDRKKDLAKAIWHLKRKLNSL